MPMRTSLLASLALAALLAGCADSAKQDEVSPVIEPNPLFGPLWINSYEAKPTETPIYRPDDYTWSTPPERYNMPFEGGDGFQFAADGKGTYIVPGIGPGPTTHAATWQREEGDKVILRIHLLDNARPDMRLEITSVAPDRLTARYLR